MSAPKLAEEGLKALEARNWDDALTKYSQALQSSASPAWLIGRSKALVGLGRIQEALDDAEAAWHSALERGKRELIMAANYRRAVAYFRLGQYANADCCCIYTMRNIEGFNIVEKEDPKLKHISPDGYWLPTYQDALDEARQDKLDVKNPAKLANKGAFEDEDEHELPEKSKVPHLQDWRLASNMRMQALSALSRLPENHDARKVTVSVKPEKKSVADLKPSKEPSVEEKAVASEKIVESKPVDPAKAFSKSPNLQHYQTKNIMSVSILSKGVDEKKLKVDFSQRSAHMDPIRYPSGGEGPFDLVFFGEIVPEECKYTVSPYKVELVLKKKNTGWWDQVKLPEDAEPKDMIVDEGDPYAPRDNAHDKVAAKQEEQGDESPTQDEVTVSRSKENTTISNSAAISSAGPSYPSSSRTGSKNWDKIAAEVDADDNSQDLDGFFKSLYKNSTPDQQRAMMKSFTESNGTALSTNWNDVKAGKVETRPPDGVEAKKWQ